MEKLAVLIPCYNEEKTIGKVVKDFQDAFPKATIYVYDNNSTDNTTAEALNSGALVFKEPLQGKGNVVRRMFQDIDADVYLLCDGDDTYPAAEGHKLVEAVLEGADMAIGDRLSNGTYAAENKRGFHRFGNQLVRHLINYIFKSDISDIMTGYRAFSRRFVKTNAIMSPGFEIETELTITSLVYRYRIKEIPITYRDRPAGSESKLNTFKDGFKVLITLFDLFKDYRPLFFFAIFAFVFFVLALLTGIPVIYEFWLTHFITKVPSAILASSLMIVALLLMSLGIILDHDANAEKRAHEQLLNEYIYSERKRKESHDQV